MLDDPLLDAPLLAWDAELDASLLDAWPSVALTSLAGSLSFAQLDAPATTAMTTIHDPLRSIAFEST